MKSFSPEQINKYLDNKGKLCPYCGSDQGMEGELPNSVIGSLLLVQKVWCSHCKMEWEDIYELKTISPFTNQNITSH